MRCILLLSLLLCVTAVSAADAGAAPALWIAGEGSRAAAIARPGDAVAPGERCVAGPHGARLALTGFVRGEVELTGGTVAVLRSEPGEGGDDLVIEVEHGEVRVDCEGTGPWRRLRTLGAAVEVEVTGTLFVVRRDERGADHVSLVRGSVQVRLRREIAASLGRDPVIALDAGQAVSGSASGLGAPAPIGGATAATPQTATAATAATVVKVEPAQPIAVVMEAQISDGLRLAGQAGSAVTDTASGAGGLGPPPPPP